MQNTGIWPFFRCYVIQNRGLNNVCMTGCSTAIPLLDFLSVGIAFIKRNVNVMPRKYNDEVICIILDFISYRLDMHTFILLLGLAVETFWPPPKVCRQLTDSLGK